MNEPTRVSQEEVRRIKEQYEQALLNGRYDLIGKIESLYKNTSLWRELEEVKKDIDEMLIA